LVRVCSGLVNLPEDGEENSDENRCSGDRCFARKRCDLLLAGNHATADDAGLNDRQFCQAWQRVPVPDKEADNSGKSQSQAEEQQRFFNPRPSGERTVDDVHSGDAASATQNACRIQSVYQLRSRGKVLCCNESVGFGA